MSRVEQFISDSRYPVVHVYADDYRIPDNSRHPTCDFGSNIVWNEQGMSLVIRDPIHVVPSLEELVLLSKPFTLSLDHSFGTKYTGVDIINGIEFTFFQEEAKKKLFLSLLKAVTLHSGEPHSRKVMSDAVASWYRNHE